MEPGLQCRCTVPTHLSVTPASFSSRVNLPQSTVLAIWQKAETLLTSETSIVLAPGTKNSWYVESTSKQVPHLVRVSPKGVVSCDKTCEHYRSISICSHVVAIAHKLGSLEAFTKSFIGRCSPNLGNFALTGMPAGRSRKGEIPPRKRLRQAYFLTFHSENNLGTREQSKRGRSKGGASKGGLSSGGASQGSGASVRSLDNSAMDDSGAMGFSGGASPNQQDSSATGFSGGSLQRYQESPYQQHYSTPYCWSHDIRPTRCFKKSALNHLMHT